MNIIDDNSKKPTLESKWNAKIDQQKGKPERRIGGRKQMRPRDSK